MVEKTIKIGDKDIQMRTSGALGIIYRDAFKSDLIVDMDKVETCAVKNKGVVKPEFFYIVEQFAYACAKHANPKIPDIKEWLTQFGMFDMMQALPDIIQMWMDETATLSSLKKTEEK